MTIAKNIKSPCNNTCKLDDDKYCIGCKRHIDEIVDWSRMSDNEKLSIIKRLESV